MEKFLHRTTNTSTEVNTHSDSINALDFLQTSQSAFDMSECIDLDLYNHEIIDESICNVDDKHKPFSDSNNEKKRSSFFSGKSNPIHVSLSLGRVNFIFIFIVELHCIHIGIARESSQSKATKSKRFVEYDSVKYQLFQYRR